LQTPDPGQTVEESAAMLQDYIGRVRDEPGVTAVGVTNRVPLAGGLFTGSYRSEQMASEAAERLEASFRFVTPEYFAAMGARLAGRSFDDADRLEVVLVDEQVADRLWPDEDPIGKRLEHSAIGQEPVLARVIGVVSPMKHGGVAEAPPPTVFLPMLAAAHQQNFRYMVVRVAGDPLAAVDRVRAALGRVDANTVMARIRPMDALYDDAVASTRFAGQLLAVFGVIAMLLAAVGLHGVLSLIVRRRTREFGIRVALGAGHRAILRSIFGSGAALVLAGAVTGLVLSLALGRFLGSLLYGVDPADTTSLATATAAILGVGLISAWLPARRIRRIDPVRALRVE
jgi:predicted permease